MNKIFKSVLLIACLSLSMQFEAKAQQTIIPDISYLFLEKLIATAKQNYPKIKQYEIAKEIAEINIKREKLNWLDPIAVSYVSVPNKTINFIDPQFFSGYQFGINVNVGTFMQKPLNIKKTKADLRFMVEESKEYALSLEAEVKVRYFAYIQQLNNVKLFTSSLQDAEGLLNDLKVRYERGEVTFGIYSEGLISFSNISKSKIESEAAFLIAKARLEELIITKIEDIK
ncbi:TolC family protein [Pedobacter cryophilus]|uniref:TolC family protein n=1 Tax=Pedobacter cryophilus TaxID=2571271 RepID=A0A4U1BZE4_9SPHI|nr:TolC family protein [Pedobacter cryophilus]TKB97888.1 TolC family protein [Pedobacter cryophilus]